MAGTYLLLGFAWVLLSNLALVWAAFDPEAGIWWAGQAQGLSRVVVRVQDEEALEVGAQGLQPRARGVLLAVLGVEEDHRAGARPR